MYEPKYYNSTNKKKALNVSHMMESFSFVVNIYGRWSYLLDGHICCIHLCYLKSLNLYRL